MTPQEILIRTEKNIPALIKNQYSKDLAKVLARFEEINTCLGRSDEAASSCDSHNRYVEQKARFLYVNYLKQGGMTEQERKFIDKNFNGWGLLRELTKYERKKEA